MFDGRDYQVAFAKACEDLQHTNDREEIRDTLIGLEWPLWEAIRGAMFVYSTLLALFFVSGTE